MVNHQLVITHPEDHPFPILVRLDPKASTRVKLPLELDGSNGKLRQPNYEANMLQVDTDIEAIEAWVASYTSVATRRAYAKEAERLLLWCYGVAGKPLSSLYLADFHDYRAFILDPPPEWCGPRRPRTSHQWRPYTGALSQRSADQAMTILKALLSYLVGAGYLMSNAMAIRAGWADKASDTEDDKRQLIQQRLNTTESGHHYFSTSDVDLIVAAAGELASPPPEGQPFAPVAMDDCERKQFLVALLLATGLRIEEVALHTMDSFRESHNSKGERVVRFRFIGKGSKMRWVPISSRMQQALTRYRRHLGLSLFPTAGEPTPLIANIRTGKPVTARTLHRLIRDVLNRAADKVKTTHPEQYKRLLQATPHWFRHTAVTEVGRHAELRLQSKFAGHADIRTTMIYHHTEDDALHDAVEKGRY